MIKLKEVLDEACWDGYKQIGTKNKGGRQVPNCVPEGVVNEESYNFGKEEYTKKNLTPTNILDLVIAYNKTPVTKIIGNKLENRIKIANDMARLTGAIQLDAKQKSGKPALILVLLKNNLITKDEYIKIYKDLILKHEQIIKYLKNASPEQRNSKAAQKMAARDMTGEFDSAKNLF